MRPMSPQKRRPKHTSIVRVSLTEADYARLVAISVKADVSLSGLMRRALRSCVDDWETALAEDRLALL